MGAHTEQQDYIHKRASFLQITKIIYRLMDRYKIKYSPEWQQSSRSWMGGGIFEERFWGFCDLESICSSSTTYLLLDCNQNTDSLHYWWWQAIWNFLPTILISVLMVMKFYGVAGAKIIRLIFRLRHVLWETKISIFSIAFNEDVLHLHYLFY